MEEKKSRRPGLQTTVRRIPSEAVKTTKNNRAAQKQAEELTRASRKASERLKNAIRFSMADTVEAKAPQAKLSDIKVHVSKTEKKDSKEKTKPAEKTVEKFENKAVARKPEPKEEEPKPVLKKEETQEEPAPKKDGRTEKVAEKTVSGIRDLADSGKKMTHRLVRAGKILTKTSADNQMEKRQKRVYKQRLIILAILAVCLLFVGSCVYHVFHFDRNTTVNGVDVSGLSVHAAAEKMASASKNYSLRITGDGGVQDEIRDSMLNVKVTDPSGLKKAMRKQNPFTWITDGFRKKKITADIEASFDEDRLKADIAALSILQEDNMEKPVDAALTETNDGHYQIEKETIGSTFDVDQATALITNAVGNYQRSVDISSSQQHPGVYSTSKNLAERMKQWNSYLEAAGISYNFPAKTVTLESSDLAKLLSDDGETVTVSYAKVADLMANWRETYDTYNNSFRFKTESGETIKTWYEGDYGFELNEEGTAKDLIANIKAKDTGNHDPKWYHKGNSMDNMGLGDTYVEVSIEDQHLWVHKDGEVVVDTDVVTGNPNPDDKGRNRETYKGCYAIKGKYEKVTLGSLDVQGYASPVNYWVPFNGGEGLHDAPWRDEFGGTIYQNNGSHGCVNCPEDMMGKIYANVEEGEAVIIY